jgi:hypothetical protein
MAGDLERERKEQVEAWSDRLRETYTPGTPVTDPQLFSGRTKLLEELRADLGVTGVHLVLFGEQGVGKTSLWRVLLDGRRVTDHHASAEDNFVSIFLRVLRELGADLTVSGTKNSAEISASLGKEGVASVGGKSGVETSFEPVAPPLVDLNLVIDRLKEHGGKLDAIVIDEFHVVRNPAVHAQISEVVKAIGDKGLKLTLVIVGVAESATELLRGTKWDDYLGRHLHTRKVPRMSDDEIRGIIELREARDRYQFNDAVKDAIVEVAAHEPATAHQLALDASIAWLRRVIAGQALSGLAWTLKKVFGRSFDVRKVGSEVELEDFRSALTLHTDRFRNDRGNLAARYEAALVSAGSERVLALLGALTRTVESSMSADELAKRLELTETELSRLADGDAQGLIVAKNGGYALAVRELGSFAAADRWCRRNPATAGVG